MKNLNELNLTELSSLELRDFQGGDTHVYFKDDQGYTWHYTYSDAGSLTGICVSQGSVIFKQR